MVDYAFSYILSFNFDKENFTNLKSELRKNDFDFGMSNAKNQINYLTADFDDSDKFEKFVIDYCKRNLAIVKIIRSTIKTIYQMDHSGGYIENL
jgi:hypothetical protein